MERNGWLLGIISVLFLLGLAMPVSAQVAGSPACTVYRDTGQNLPAGLYRVCVTGDQIVIDHNTAATGNFSTFNRSAVASGASLDCSSQTGSSASIKIAACAAVLQGVGGGVADARNLLGAQTWNTDAFSGITVPTDFPCVAGTYTVSTNSTLPSNVHLLAAPGCIFKPNSGVTLTINGSMDGSSVSQHFDLSAGGIVQFGTTADITKTYVINSNVPTAYAAWFGRTATCGIQEAGTAVQKSGGGTVVYTNSDCVMSAGVNIDCNAALTADRALTITGEGPRTAVWVNASITTDVITVTGTPGGQHCAGTKIANLNFNPNLAAGPAGGNVGIISHNFITLVANDRFTIEHVFMGGSTGNGIQLQRDFSGTIQDIKATNITTVIHSGSNLIGEATNNILVFDSEFFDTGNLVMSGVLSCDAFCDDWQFFNNHVEGVNKTNATIINNQGGNARSWKIAHNSFNSVLASGSTVITTSGRTGQIIGNDFRNISAGTILNIQTGAVGTIITGNTFDTISGASTRTGTLNENDVIVANNHCLTYTPNQGLIITGGLTASIYNNDGCAEPNDVITVLNTTGASSVAYVGAVGPYDYAVGQGHLFGLGGVTATNNATNSSMLRMSTNGGGAGSVNLLSDASGTGRGQPFLVAMCTGGACTQIMQWGIRDTNGGGLLVGASGTVPATGGLTATGAVIFSGLTSAGAQDYVCFNTATGALVQGTAPCTASGPQYKHDFEPLDAGLATVLQIPTWSYVRNDHPEIGRQVGLRADQVLAVDPRLVALDEEGKADRVRYDTYTAVLTKAIQDLYREVEAIKRQCGDRCNPN